MQNTLKYVLKAYIMYLVTLTQSGQLQRNTSVKVLDLKDSLQSAQRREFYCPQVITSSSSCQSQRKEVRIRNFVSSQIHLRRTKASDKRSSPCKSSRARVHCWGSSSGRQDGPRGGWCLLAPQLLPQSLTAVLGLRPTAARDTSSLFHSDGLLIVTDCL